MAASDSRNPNSLTSPSQISKDMPAPDNPIPLSPQWLLPKPAENKTGMTFGENRPSPFTGHGDRSDFIKSSGIGEELLENQKKKDVFRPTFLDAEPGRRDRWRDEERDTNLSARRDRRREGEKEIGDGRKTDRWVDTSSTRNFGEARRAPSDKWADPNKDNSFEQRRESKWNSRWGPDGKEMDKWTDVEKHSDLPHEKGLSHLVTHGKDEREGDHYRPWRPSSLQGRAKAEPPHHQAQTIKDGPTFGHGRGRGEIAPTFSAGRGRINFGSVNNSNNYSVHSHTGLNSDRGDNGLGEPSPFRYNRTKLLDVYRHTDIKSSNKILDGLTQVSSLTQEEPLEPLALSPPTPEELAILKGIDKGEILSSGAPQISKDGSAGRSSNDFAQSRRSKHGSRDDVSLPSDEASDKTDHAMGPTRNLEYSPHEKQMHAYGSNVSIDGNENSQMPVENKYRIPAARDDDVALRKGDEVIDNRDSGIKGHNYPQSGTPWRSPSVEEHAKSHSRDWFDNRSEIRSKDRSDGSWSQAPKDRSDEWENEIKWKISEDSAVRKHLAVDHEQESRKLLHPSPEDLLLYYKDPQGQVQGPFSGGDIIGWFEAGYFGIDLLVRPVNAPNDSAFSLLGDVMPHLRAKVRPPPGFNPAKQNEGTDVSSKSGLSGFGKVLPGPGGIELLMNEHRQIHGSSTEAENRFLESLMAGDVSSATLEKFASSEGMQGFMGLTSGSMPPLGVEGGDALSLLAQRMSLERQNSLTHPYPYWPTRDGANVVPSPDILRNPTVPPQANLLSSAGEIPRQSLSHNAEMMSILQGLSDRSAGGTNNGLGGWPNFTAQGAMDPFKDNKVDLHHGQNFSQVAYGMQQQKLQQQNHPSLNNLLAQSLENPTILSDKRPSSGLAQDPQALNLLQMQQQYLMQQLQSQQLQSQQLQSQHLQSQQLQSQQLQSQQSAPNQQISLLEKVLLLRQQKQQEEQQQLLRQQQQLLSQVLSEQQHALRFSEPAFGQFQASAPLVGNAHIDHSVPQLSSSLFQVNSQIPVPGVPDERNGSSGNIPLNVSQDLGPAVPSEGQALHLPHQIQKSWHSLQTHADNISNNVSSGSEMKENITASEAMENPQSAASLEHSISEFIPPFSIMDSEMSAISADSVPWDDEILTSEKINDVQPIPSSVNKETSVQESQEEVQVAKEANKNVEVREVKKASDKKQRKVKSSKAQPSPDQVKGASKVSSAQKSKQSEIEGALVADKLGLSVSALGTLDGRPMEMANEVSNAHDTDFIASSNLPDCVFESTDAKSEQKQSDSSSQQNAKVSSTQRAWKPAVSVKPKSLIEIQQEEQKRAQMEISTSSVTASISPKSFSSPWAGVMTHSEHKVPKEIHQNSTAVEPIMGKPDLSKSKKSGLHDLLAAEVLAKSSDKFIEVGDNASSLPPLPTVPNQLDAFDDENFIEAKDTKKSRKKAAKAKGAGAKVPAAVSPADMTSASSPIEKGKSSKAVRAEKEVLPAPPSGPSLGDFVPWKGESTSPSIGLAWSTDSGKVPKPTSLRDILKEQGKKSTPSQQQPPVSTPQKSNSAQARPGSWSVSAQAPSPSPSPSPSKATSPAQVHSHDSSQSKYKGEDDLFWGPPDQTKQETKQAGFPQLGNPGNWVTKNTPVKGTPGAISRQKSSSSRGVEQISSSSPATMQVSVKGKRDGTTKRLEAMDFRDWCESESVRLTGSKDTSFLEFCLKQSRSEAETLLIENLGSFDPNHEFIEKFLNYKELLAADVIELAFQSRNDLKVYNNGARDMNSDNAGYGNDSRDNVAGADESSKGGKKKGKKGKKVSPAVLGFNVVSNRIMMGEIQSVED